MVTGLLLVVQRVVMSFCGCSDRGGRRSGSDRGGGGGGGRGSGGVHVSCESVGGAGSCKSPSRR